MTKQSITDWDKTAPYVNFMKSGIRFRRLPPQLFAKSHEGRMRTLQVAGKRDLKSATDFFLVLCSAVTEATVTIHRDILSLTDMTKFYIH